MHFSKAMAILVMVWGMYGLRTDAATLVQDGEPNAVLVIAEKSASCVPTAAAELQAYIQKMTGATLEVKKVPDDATAPLAEFVGGKVALLIGASAYTRQLDIQPEALAKEGFYIRSIPEGLAIVGRDGDGHFNLNFDRSTTSAGTLYGVYRFLEELGCRWFYPDPQYEVVPEMATLELPDFDIRDEPYFEYRFAYGNYEWRRKVGYGGTVDPWRTRHSLAERMNKQYGESHAEVLKQGAHFPHPGVIDLVVDQARQYLSSTIHPGRKYFLVIPPDAYGGCDCSICTPLRTPERGPHGEFADIIGAAVVETAERVKDLPGKIVYCAYEKYRLPPRNISSLPDNVVVLMAIHRAAFHDPAAREQAWEMIDSWRSLEPSRFYFCRYYADFRKVTPSFVPHLIDDDIKRMRDYREAEKLPIGGEMNFGSAAPDHPYAWWFCLNEYVTAKLLWNPHQDVDELLDDYYESFFGAAAAPMKKLFTRLEELYSVPEERHLYSVEVIDELLGYFAEAERLTAGTQWQKHVAYIGEGLQPLVMMKRRLSTESKVIDLEGPDIHFTFDEGRGRVVYAVEGDVKGELTRTTWARGIRGAALRLDGTSSFVQFSSKSLAGTNYSYEMWLKPEAVTFDRSQYLLGPGRWERHGLALRSGTLTMMHRYQGSSYFNTRSRLFAHAAEFKPHEWHHVAATFSKDNGMALYVNGVLVAMDPSLTKASEYGIAFIGAGGHSSGDDMIDHFKGVIDEVKIYRRELSPREVQDHYQLHRPE